MHSKYLHKSACTYLYLLRGTSRLLRVLLFYPKPIETIGSVEDHSVQSRSKICTKSIVTEDQIRNHLNYEDGSLEFDRLGRCENQLPIYDFINHGFNSRPPRVPSLRLSEIPLSNRYGIISSVASHDLRTFQPSRSNYQPHVLNSRPFTSHRYPGDSRSSCFGQSFSNFGQSDGSNQSSKSHLQSSSHELNLSVPPLGRSEENWNSYFCKRLSLNSQPRCSLTPSLNKSSNIAKWYPQRCVPNLLPAEAIHDVSATDRMRRECRDAAPLPFANPPLLRTLLPRVSEESILMESGVKHDSNDEAPTDDAKLLQLPPSGPAVDMSQEVGDEKMDKILNSSTISSLVERCPSETPSETQSAEEDVVVIRAEDRKIGSSIGSSIGSNYSVTDDFDYFAQIHLGWVEFVGNRNHQSANETTCDSLYRYYMALKQRKGFRNHPTPAPSNFSDIPNLSDLLENLAAHVCDLICEAELHRSFCYRPGYRYHVTRGVEVALWHNAVLGIARKNEELVKGRDESINSEELISGRLQKYIQLICQQLLASLFPLEIENDPTNSPNSRLSQTPIISNQVRDCLDEVRITRIAKQRFFSCFCELFGTSLGQIEAQRDTAERHFGTDLIPMAIDQKDYVGSSKIERRPTFYVRSENDFL